MTLDINHLRQWIGRGEEASDVVTAAPLAGLQATLDRNDPAPQPGDVLPPSAHWLYFLPATRQSDLDENGHAKKGDFLPPVSLERRMWAGGRIQFLADLHIGDAITRASEILDVSLKEGKSGPLVFVVVRHRVTGPNGLAIEEEHDIVYRGALPKGAPSTSGPVAPGEAAWQRTIDPDPVLLFRYSALIFNGHRIHYDRAYVMEEEGYPGLIVHGPLMGMLQIELARRSSAGKVVRSFEFRALSPVFGGAALGVHGRREGDGSITTWIADPNGGLAQQGKATFR